MTFGYTSIDIVGLGVDAGAGVDVDPGKRFGVRLEVRGLAVHDKSGFDGFAMWRVGGVIGLGR